MSESARAGFEHRQDVLVQYGPPVVEKVLEGPVPSTALDVTTFWPDTGSAPAAVRSGTISTDYWQVVRGRVKVFPGISKTGTATIQPDG